MPIYMDVHYVPGVAAFDVAVAHQKDVEIQDDHHCKCMTYWMDESRGAVFCLIDAPEKSQVEEMHRRAHGLIPHKILEVSPDVIESFLGRIHDPDGVVISDGGLKVFSDPAYRVLLVFEGTDPVLLRHSLGPEEAERVLNRQFQVVGEAVPKHGGRAVEHAGGGWVASFTSAASAVGCALDIQCQLPDATTLRIGISGGEPIAGSDRIFGDAIQLGRRLCGVKAGNRIAVSSSVMELLSEDFRRQNRDGLATLAPQDERLMSALCDTLDKNWQVPEFTVEKFCQSAAMSKSQLYRKTVALWDLPPNLLLRRYRLDRARESLRKHAGNITEATFQSGFTSPSYFTKCFKKAFGVLPAAYAQARL